MRLLYEQAAQEQRQLAERLKAARGDEGLIASFERRAADLEKLARPAIERLSAAVREGDKR